MIRLVFSANRELIHFLIIEKNIYYSDKKWAAWIRCLPKPEDFIKRIQFSRNKFPSFLINLFNYSKEELEQYAKANSEEEIALIVIADAKIKGCRLVLKRTGNIEDEALKKNILESELVADISQKEVKQNSIA
ncbi:MAG: hypothetical protein ACHQ1D_01020 [Nitrososphaerales archaeon]